jgi:hypothetical protein
MITIKKNESFPKWMQIFVFGAMVEEVNGQAKALRLGKRLARKNKLDYLYFLDDVVKVG